MPLNKLVNTIGLITATVGSILVWFFLTEILTCPLPAVPR